MKLLSHTTPRAKVPHTCSFCHRQISIGEIYDKITFTYDGLHCQKSHSNCTELANKLRLGEEYDPRDPENAEKFRELLDKES